jgi:hypothetical protein
LSWAKELGGNERAHRCDAVCLLNLNERTYPVLIGSSDSCQFQT